MRIFSLAVLGSCALLAGACEQSRQPPPSSAGGEDRRPVLEDAPFAWLDENTSARALSWVRDENEKTLAALGADPRFDVFEREAAAVLTAPDRLPNIRIRGDFVYNYWQDETHVFGLWRRAPYDGFIAGAPAWETLIDLDALSAEEDREWILQGADFAPGLSDRVLVRLSHKGQDAFVLREFDLAQKAFVADGFALPESKSRVWWKDEDVLILASALEGAPKTEAGAPKTLALWRRGDAPEDAAAPYFKASFTDFTVTPAFLGMTGDNDAVAQAVDFFSREYWLRDVRGVLHPLPLPSKMEPMGRHGDGVILLLEQDWAPDGPAFRRGDLVTVSAQGLFERRAVEDARLVYRPAPDEEVRNLRVLGGVVHLNLLKSLRGRVVALEETADGYAAQLVDSFDEGFIRFGPNTPEGDGVFAVYEGPLAPPALYRLEGGTGEKTLIARQSPAFGQEGLVEEIRHATSDDGTQIPYTLIYQEGMERDGARPALVYGYGGFDVSVTPRYEPLFGKLWLEKGGVYVHAHLRGGGEFGPKWHHAPMLDQRPRVYEDMAAVLRDLHETGISAPRHTGIMGRSNGGLMTAAVMVRDHGLMNAVVVGGPLIDMLRYDKSGPGASWVAEYGDPDIPEQRSYIAGYSPIQNLDPEASYPAPLVITSTYDDRVWPGHARRFAAQMQAMGHDVLYYEDDAGGHYWELAGGPAPGDWRKRATARAVEFIYLARALELD